MATTIVTKYGGDAPAASDIVRGELAVDTENGRLYTENAAGAVVEIGLNPEGNIDVTGSVTADGLTNNGDVVFSKSTTGVPIIKMSGFANANSPYGIINFYNEDGSQQGPNNAVQIKALAKNSDGSGGELAFYTSTGTGSEGADAVERLRIAANGNVGIGMAPDANNVLSVKNTSGKVVNFTNGVDADLYVDLTSGLTLVSPSTGTLAFGTSNTERLRIDSSGNVGIGVTNPDTKLEVRNPTQATDTVNTLLTQRWSRAQTSAVKWGNSMDLLLGSYESGTINSRTRVDFKLADGATDDPDTTVMTLQGNGNVGIGTSAPTKSLAVHASSGDTYVDISRATQSQGQVALQLVGGTGGQSWIMYQPASSNDLRFFTNSSDRVVFDASGNLLVGKSTTAIETVGINLFGTGRIISTADGDDVAVLNRKTSDGDIAVFKKDGTTVGSILSSGGDGIIVQGVAAGSGLLFHNSDALLPAQNGNAIDATIDLGRDTPSAFRFKDLYLSGRVIAHGVTTLAYAWSSQSDSTSSSIHLYFRNPNGFVGNISTSGTATAYNTSSDYRLKENVVAISGATERLKQLKPSRFNFIADADTTVDGFLAHEVQDVVPEAITGTKDAVDADGNPEYQGIDQSKLVPLLVATIQELEARIAALES